MSHYRFIVFSESGEPGAKIHRINKDNLAAIDGYICGSEVFSLDTLRWMLPEMSEEKLHETFQKILKQKIEEAEGNGSNVVYADVVL